MSMPSQRGRAAEDDDTGPVTASQRVLYHLNRAAHGPLGRRRRRASRLERRIDQHHHVGGPLAEPLGDVQRASPRADRPVDRAQLVTRHVGADVAVLDATADVPGEVRAEPVEQLDAGQRGRLRGRDREHEDVGGGHGRRAGEQSAAGRPAHPYLDGIAAPPLRRPSDHDPTGVVGRDVEHHAVGGRDGEFDRRPVGRSAPHHQPHLFGFEAAQHVRLGVHVHLGRRTLPPDGRQNAEERRGERDQLPRRAEHRAPQRHGRAGGQGPGQRRCLPMQFDRSRADVDHVAPRVLGTATRRNRSSTTSELRTCLTHISGRRLIRWAIAGTASALTSSGMT